MCSSKEMCVNCKREACTAKAVQTVCVKTSGVKIWRTDLCEITARLACLHFLYSLIVAELHVRLLKDSTAYSWWGHFFVFGADKAAPLSRYCSTSHTAAVKKLTIYILGKPCDGYMWLIKNTESEPKLTNLWWRREKTGIGQPEQWYTQTWHVCVYHCVVLVFCLLLQKYCLIQSFLRRRKVEPADTEGLNFLTA